MRERGRERESEGKREGGRGRREQGGDERKERQRRQQPSKQSTHQLISHHSCVPTLNVDFCNSKYDNVHFHLVLAPGQKEKKYPGLESQELEKKRNGPRESY